ncbi:MAG TPA: Fic family protein [Steroidobacteraceae bacterium]|nr:Fic family protein [Steroidobacteraceae bacterium]
MARLSPLEQARRWWKKHARAERYVVSPAEAPSAAVARVLRQEGLVFDVAGRRAWILTTEKTVDGRAVFLANYWAVVVLVLKRYEPAAVAGIAAIRLHLEDFSPPEDLPAYQGANQSEYALTLYPGFRLRLRPRRLKTAATVIVTAPGNVQLPVQAPADILTTLDESEVRGGIEPVSAWLRHLVVRTPDLEGRVEKNPRPVILKRLADLAAELHNEPLARQLEQLVRRISSRTTTPSRTGVGTRITVPQALHDATRGSGSPWLDEQAMRLARQVAEIRQIVGTAATRLPKFTWSLLRANAEQNKAYDAYHSTTMEGYRISREIADAIVRGEPLPEGPQDAKTREAAMAVQGYTIAYGLVLERARRKERIDGALLLDLHEALFRPSVDAGITDTAALRGWRAASVGLRGWRFVPPNPKKIPDLIGGLERFAARKDIDPIARALLVHLEFVTIHPFMDGNGRLGRLLMNNALLTAGLPWVTIRSDERVPFFRAIERAQVDDDAGSYIEFVWHLIRQTLRELTPRARARNAR